MVNSKTMVVKEEVHAKIESHKVQSREPMGDVVERIINEWEQFKAQQQ